MVATTSSRFGLTHHAVDRDESQESVLEANFGRAVVRPPLENPNDAAGVALRQPLAALRAWSAPARAPGWWHWVVGGRSRQPGHAASGRLAHAGRVGERRGGHPGKGARLAGRGGRDGERGPARPGDPAGVAGFGVRPGDAAVIVAVRRPPVGAVAVVAPVNVLDAVVGDLAGEAA